MRNLAPNGAFGSKNGATCDKPEPLQSVRPVVENAGRACKGDGMSAATRAGVRAEGVVQTALVADGRAPGRAIRALGLLAAGLLAGMTGPARADDLRAQTFLAPCALADNEEFCRFMADKFTKDWSQAMRGRIESQRNVAFCLRDGCDGAVATNTVLACAWRMVIIASGSPKLDDLDARNFESACHSLSETARIAADAQARQIVHRTMR